MFSTYIFTVTLSSWWSVSFITMQLPSCFLTNFGLKAILLHMSTDILASFQIPFAYNIIFHLLTFSLCISLSVRWVSCRQKIVASFLKNTLYAFLIEKLKPFTLRLIIERCVLILVALFFCCFEQTTFIYYYLPYSSLRFHGLLNHVWFFLHSLLLIYSSSEVYSFPCPCNFVCLASSSLGFL
jgi:hypothetical protein